MPHRYRTDEERVIANSEPDAATGCWLWIGRIGGGASRNYGRVNVRIDGKHVTELAHRFSYRVFKGAIRAGMTVDHTCSNPLCVNPDHLRLMTNANNAAARWTRARQFNAAAASAGARTTAGAAP